MCFYERSELLIDDDEEKSTQKTSAFTKKRPPSPTAAQSQSIYELLIRQKNRGPHTEQNTPTSEASY